MSRSDAGAGGRAGALWSIGQLGLLAAAHGAVPPEGSFRFRTARFHLAEALGATGLSMRAFDDSAELSSSLPPPAATRADPGVSEDMSSVADDTICESPRPLVSMQL